MKKIQPFSQKCGEFIDWLRDEKGISILKYDEEEKVYCYIHQSTDKLLAEFFEIDQDKIEN